MIKFIFTFFVFIFFIPIVYSTPISTCQTLNTPNTAYTLTTDITNHVGTCFTISANNVSLDCQSNTIDGDDVGTSDYGVYFNSFSDGSRLENCQITDFSRGIYSESSDDLEIYNVTTSSNTDGIFLSNSNNVNITGINSINNGDDGLELSSSDFSIIHNITLTGNNGNGLLIPSSSVSNSITQLNAYSNSDYDIEVTSSSNSFYGNSISSSASITDSGSNFWNSSTPFVGNFYGDFGPCLTNETRIFNGKPYLVCTNPSSFDLGGGIFDYAPLASFVYINYSTDPEDPPDPGDLGNPTAGVAPYSGAPIGGLGSIITAIGTLALFFLFGS